MRREAIYKHDFASIPSEWVEVADPNGDWWTMGQTAVRKGDSIFMVSNEFLEDYGRFSVWDMLREETWEERLARLVYDSRPDRRLRRFVSGRWAAFRQRLAQAIYPEREWD